MPTTYRELDDPAPVLLRDQGREVPGWLLAWRRDRDGWRAYVEWSMGVRPQPPRMVGRRDVRAE